MKKRHTYAEGNYISLGRRQAHSLKQSNIGVWNVLKPVISIHKEYFELTTCYFSNNISLCQYFLTNL